jgi:hypothetical protein
MISIGPLRCASSGHGIVNGVRHFHARVLCCLMSYASPRLLSLAAGESAMKALMRRGSGGCCSTY